MDKNHIIGFTLIFLLMIGFVYYSQPSEAELAERQRYNDSIAAVEQAQAEAQKIADEAQKAIAAQPVEIDSTSLFGVTKAGEAQDITLKNELVSLNVSTLGAAINKAVLSDYKNQQGEPVVLFDEDLSKIDYTFALKEENLRTAQHYFEPSNVSDSTVTMRLPARDGSALVFDYKLIPGTYMVNLTISAEGNLDRYFLPSENCARVDWKDTIRQQEKGHLFENRYSTLTYKRRGSSTKQLSEVKDDEKQPEETLDWIAFKNQFFSYVLIGYDGIEKASLHSTPLEKGSGNLKYYEAQFQLPFDPTGSKETQLQFYIGPNKFRLLQAMDRYSRTQDKALDLDELVDLGWPIIRYINRFFTIYIFDWLTALHIPMGIVLLLITILLKIIVYPTTRKSYLSSAKMRVLRPKLDAINEKYPNQEDAMKKQQEIMATYSKYGVSPVGGCLPMIIQMPIWIAMFNFVPNAIELRQQSFLWADDLSTYDDLINWGFNLPLIGDHLSIFCLLFCVSNLLYSWVNMRMQKDSMVGQQADQMKMMQWMMMLMPVAFFFMFNDYSSGLNYYYFVSLVCSVLTMWYLRWSTDDAKLLAKLEAYYEKNKDNPKKVSNLAARLEALQKQQEAQRQQMQHRR